MNNKFKYSPLAIIIASALSISGCDNSNNNTQSDAVGSSSSNSVADNMAEANTDKARVKLAVKFPQADARAAWADDSKSIEVSFFNTQTVGSIAQAYETLNKACGTDDGYYNECYSDNDSLSGQFATSVFMDTGSPSAYVDLLPGKYRIEAKFSNAQGKHQETSVSYVTLSKGEHSLKLRGLEATWTATEQLNLQLLNRSDAFDWDPDSEGAQSAAAAMGITGAIKGLHLPTVLTYPDGYLRANNGDQGQADNKAALINAGVTNSGQLNKESQATAFQPVLRIANTVGGESNLLPRFLSTSQENFDEQDYFTGASGYWNETEVATLQQEYSSEGDNAALNLGGYSMGYWNYDNDTMTSIEDSAYLILGIGSLDSGAGKAQYSILYRNDWDGQNAGEQLTIARIQTDNEASNWQQLFVDLQATPNKVVDGSTISGYLIEAKAHTIRDEVDGLEGAGKDVQPVSFLEAALFDIAATEGLVAQGAAENNCSTQEISGVEYSNDYLWDEAQLGWVAGTYNTFLSENGLLAEIEERIAGETEVRDDAQSELDASQGELAVYDNEIVAIVEAQMADVTITEERNAELQTTLDEIASNSQLTIYDYNDNWELYNDREDALWPVTDALENVASANDALTQLAQLKADALATADLNGDGEATIFEEGVYLATGSLYGWINQSDSWDETTDQYNTSYYLELNDFVIKETVKATSFSGEQTICVQPFTLKASQLSMAFDTAADVVIE